MMYYKDYFWKKGRPCGRGAQRDLSNDPKEKSYAIRTDPYHKRFSIELYLGDRLEEVVYDSLLFDFRRLSLSDQQGWQRELICQNETSSTFWIRNQEDRAILQEKLEFAESFCRSCYISGPQGLLLATQKMFYTHLGDAWDGTLLYDRHQHIVLAKRYRVNEEGVFEELLEERLDLSSLDFLERWQGRFYSAASFSQTPTLT